MSIAAVIERTVLHRRALLVLLASAPLLPTITAYAQNNAALNDATKDAVLAFLKALRNEDMDEAMQFVAAPFVAEDAQIFATEAEVKAYLTDMCLELPAAEMPNEVLAILDYDQSRRHRPRSAQAARHRPHQRRPPGRHRPQRPLPRRAAGESERWNAGGGGGGVLGPLQPLSVLRDPAAMVHRERRTEWPEYRDRSAPRIA
jgi:hypothetical protein